MIAMIPLLSGNNRPIPNSFVNLRPIFKFAREITYKFVCEIIVENQEQIISTPYSGKNRTITNL